MTDWDTFAAMREVFQEINRNVGDFEEQDEVTADDVLAYFEDDNKEYNIQMVDRNAEFTIHHTPVDDVYEWDDPWLVTYGLDGSTTTPLSFQNGLLVGAAAAKLGVAGQTDKTDLADETTIAAVCHLNDEEFDLPEQHLSVNGADAHLFRFPNYPRESSMEKWVVEIARGYAETMHAERLADEVDGPLFLDGPIYPNQMFGWMLFEQAPRSPTNPAQLWPEMISGILQSAIDTVETMERKGLPLVGVTKTSYTSRAIVSLEERIPSDSNIETPLRWSYDHQLFSEALETKADKYGDDGAVISYTPWLVQRQQDARGDTVVPFKTYSGVDLPSDFAQDYQRAFFYVRTPMTDKVMRVEAPYVMVDRKNARDSLQRKALCELAQQQKEPRAVTMADDRARITQKMRNDLRSIITNATPTVDYNEDRDYREFDRD